MTRNDIVYFGILITALLLYAVVRGVLEAQKYGPRDEGGCPEEPYMPPAIIKHKAVKDRMALRLQIAHEQEEAEAHG